VQEPVTQGPVELSGIPCPGTRAWCTTRREVVALVAPAEPSGPALLEPAENSASWASPGGWESGWRTQGTNQRLREAMGAYSSEVRAAEKAVHQADGRPFSRVCRAIERRQGWRGLRERLELEGWSLWLLVRTRRSGPIR